MPRSSDWPDFNSCLPADDVFKVLVGDADPTLARLGALYDRNRPDLVPVRETPSIPRVIHQIWLGSPLPRKLARYSRTWRKHHPDWELKLWTDAEVAGYDFPSRELFDAAQCWGQKSDLLRMEILNSEGGVYVDLDYECFKPIDVLTERYDFFTTLKYIYTAHLGWPAIWQHPVVVCNSLIGAQSGHPILSAYLERVAALWDDKDRYELKDGELIPIALAAMGGKAKAARIKETGTRTFIPFGDTVTALADDAAYRNIVLPPLFFNPVLTGARTLYMMPDFWLRCREQGVKWPKLKTYTRTHPLTLANHISHNSWV